MDEEMKDVVSFIFRNGVPEDARDVVTLICDMFLDIVTRIEAMTVLHELEFDIAHGQWLDRYEGEF